ncbi:hypothetical protein [Kutzneria albida]|nr:hypothetical protein [Kutzneria albida]
MSNRVKRGLLMIGLGLGAGATGLVWSNLGSDSLVNLVAISIWPKPWSINYGVDEHRVATVTVYQHEDGAPHERYYTPVEKYSGTQAQATEWMNARYQRLAEANGYPFRQACGPALGYTGLGVAAAGVGTLVLRRASWGARQEAEAPDEHPTD